MGNIDKYRINSNSFNAMMGSFIASHAISDSVVFLAITIGCKAKVTHNSSNHDRVKEYTDRMGWSEFTEDDLIYGKLERIYSSIIGQLNRREFGFVPVIMSPLVKTIGLDIESYLEDNNKRTLVPVKFIPLSSSKTDYWEGYLEVMKAFAQTINWKQKPINKNLVNIWGYPFDRYEKDHLGNISVLKSTLKSVGLEVNSIFFSGESSSQLRTAHKAKFNIILPHASKLGTYLEKLTRRRSIYTEYPLGLKGTEKWLLSLASHLKLDLKKITDFIHLESKKREQSLLAHKFQYKDKKVALILDTPWIGSVSSFFTELGFKVVLIVKRDSYYGDLELIKNILSYFDVDYNHIQFLDSTDKILISKNVEELGVDIILGSSIDLSYFKNNDDILKLTFGFPSYDKHYLDGEAPFLCYKGFDLILDDWFK